jgi:hypothetical protein
MLLRESSVQIVFALLGGFGDFGLFDFITLLDLVERVGLLLCP